jgi:hypothetical protein
MMYSRHLRWLTAPALLLATLGACSKGPKFPPTIDYNGQHLEKSAAWERGKLAGIVWTKPGEKPPAASLQIGAIVSDQHQTARELNQWISSQAGQRFYDSDGITDSNGPDMSCRMSFTPLPDGRNRTYMSLVTCQTGVGRSACVEADEDLPEEDFTTCLQDRHRQCEVLCDQRWEKHRESLDTLAASMLTKR